MVVHFKTGTYDTGEDKTLCNRFTPKSDPNTTKKKEEVTCGLCLRILNGYK